LKRDSIDPIQRVDWPLSEWTARADALITTGSGTALEAFALGIPVVLVGASSSLTYDPFAWFDGLDAGPYFSAAAIIDRLGALNQERPRKQAQDRAEAAVRIRAAWFAAVTSEALARFASD
jgi:hypothetical protein